MNSVIEIIENYLIERKATERYMLYIILIIFFGFIFYNYVYEDFKSNEEFVLLQRISIEKKTANVERLMQIKSLKEVKRENKEKREKISNIQERVKDIDKILNRVQAFNLDFLKNNHAYTVDGNKTTFLVKESLPNILTIIDKINQYYKIEYILLQAQKDASMSSNIIVGEKLINISRKAKLLKLESPFFNINNIFNVTSIIGDSVRVNGKWYIVDDNITQGVRLHKIKEDSIIIRGINGKYKEIFFQ